jgi:hypothetical protein
MHAQVPPAVALGAEWSMLLQSIRDADATRSRSSAVLHAQAKRTPLMMESIRDAWFDRHMKRREHEFCVARPLSVFVGTWNVAAISPSQSLHPWLFPRELDGQQPDVFLIGYGYSYER